MADELVQIFTSRGKPSGRVIGKKEAHKIGLYHPCVHFFVTDGKGNLLGQFRGPQCGHMRNVWDPIGWAGHITAPVAEPDELKDMRLRDAVMTDIDSVVHAFMTGMREGVEEVGYRDLNLDMLHSKRCRYLGITRGDFVTEDGWQDRSFTHNFLLLAPEIDPASCPLEEGKVLEVRWMSIDNEILPTLDGEPTGLTLAERQPDHQWMLRLACAGAKLMEAGF